MSQNIKVNGSPSSTPRHFVTKNIIHGAESALESHLGLIDIQELGTYSFRFIIFNLLTFLPHAQKSLQRLEVGTYERLIPSFMTPIWPPFSYQLAAQALLKPTCNSLVLCLTLSYHFAARISKGRLQRNIPKRAIYLQRISRSPNYFKLLRCQARWHAKIGVYMY